MKWFKHYSGSLNSESLSDLIRDTGFQGYGRYWALIEYLAGIFDGEDVFFRIPIENIRGLFRIRSWTELGTFADRLATVRGMNLKRIGNVYEIEAPILLELLGRDFKKARAERGQSAGRARLDKDKDKDKEVPKSKSAISANQDLPPQNPIFEIWNKNRDSLPEAISLTKKRTRSLNERWKENPNQEYWAECVKRLAASEFCCGKNDRGWKATIDFILKPDTSIKVFEGAYDNKKTPRSAHGMKKL